MEYDIEETKERIEKLKRSEIKRKHLAAAKEKGFNRVEDYDVWLVLEDLRARTLRAAREHGGDGKTIGYTPVDLRAVSQRSLISAEAWAAAIGRQLDKQMASGCQSHYQCDGF